MTGEWEWQPLVDLPLLLLAASYAAGVRRLWHRAGSGRGVSHRATVTFVAAWLVLVIALASPFHQLGESLFSAHMVQHELLMVVAAPLALLGRPHVAVLWSLPVSWRRALQRWTHGSITATWRMVSQPWAACLVQAAIIWAWHSPRLYDAAVLSEPVHALQHLSFLGGALLFWWTIIERGRARATVGPSIGALVVTAAHTSALGILLTFAPDSLYAVYHNASASGMTPLEDQQLAGLIMWIPGGVAYVVATLALLAFWLRSPRSNRQRASPRLNDTSLAT